MATEVGISISLLIEKLQKLLVLAKGRFLIFPGLRNRVRDAVNELKLILSFLPETENNTSSSSSSSCSLQARLLPTVYFAEHITDVFLLNANTTTRRRPDGVTVTSNFIEKPLMVFPPRTQIQFSSKMKKIVKSFRSSYGEFADQLQARVHDLTNKTLEFDAPIFVTAAIERHQYDDDDVVVGRGDDEEEIVARLIEDEEQSLRVISLVGEEAIGKTALARKAYNRLDIRQHFQCRAWIHVPKEFAYKDLLLIILRQTPYLLKDVELMKENELSIFLFKTLMEQRFLMVLDDVSTIDVWLKFVRPFADAANGSRVILTTRNSKVASDVDPWSDPLNLMLLTEDYSWELFLKKVARRPKNNTNYDTDTDHLNNFRAEILRICHGLPAAIVLLEGLLSTVKLSEWSTVTDRLLEDHHHHLFKSIVDLSYDKLPSVLKPCFLYLALFPKEYEIPTRRLLQLWVAEGFVQISLSSANNPNINSEDTEATQKNSEDMAKTYLEELVGRNMIEIAKWKSDGSPKTCRMPCFLYDVFLRKAEDVGFLHVHHPNSDCTFAEDSHIIRRIADQYFRVKSTSESQTQHLCSYVCFEAQKRVTSNTEIGNLLNTLINRGKGFVPMKVLDLEGVYKPSLPEKFGHYLQNLRYIGLRWTSLYSCPESIGDLQCLETLDLKYTNITTLPSSIWKAKNLRHLNMTGVSIEKPSKESSTSTSNLQTLTGIVIGSKEEDLDDNDDDYHLDRFTDLRKLGLTCHSKSVKKAVESISRLDNLQTLKLRSRDLPFGQASNIMLSPLKDHRSLSKLHLFGVIKGGIHNLPRNLKILTLSMSELKNDPMQVLGMQLPQLNVLRLFGRSYVGVGMECLSGYFPELRVLKLWMLEDLRWWTVKEGAMPQLVELEIRSCNNLKNLNGLEKLPVLKELILTNMPKEFVTDFRTKLDRDILVTNDWKSFSLSCKFNYFTTRKVLFTIQSPPPTNLNFFLLLLVINYLQII